MFVGLGSGVSSTRRAPGPAAAASDALQTLLAGMDSGEWAKLNSTTQNAGNIFHSSVIPTPTQARQDGRLLTSASTPAGTWATDSDIASSPAGTQSPALVDAPSTTPITGRGIYPGVSSQTNLFAFCKPGVRVDVAAGKVEMIWGFPGGHNDAAAVGLIYADVIAGAAAKNASATDGLVFEERIKPPGYLSIVHGDTIPVESPQFNGTGAEWIATRNADNILVPINMHTYAHQIWMPALNRFHLSAPFGFSNNATARPGAVWGYDPDTDTVDIYYNAGDITTRTGFSYMTGTGGSGDGALVYDTDNDTVYTASTGNLYRWTDIAGTPTRAQANSDTNSMFFDFLTEMAIITSPIDGSKMIFQHRDFSGTMYSAISGVTGTTTWAGNAIFGGYSGATFDLTPTSQDWKSGICPHPTKPSAVLLWQGTDNIFEVDLAAKTTAGSYTAPSAVFDSAGTGDSPGAVAGTNHRITHLPSPWNALLCCALHGSGVSADMGVWVYKL